MKEDAEKKKEEQNQLLSELMTFTKQPLFLNERELKQDAITKRFQDEFGIYLEKEYLEKVGYGGNLNANFEEIVENVKKDFEGDIENYRKFHTCKSLIYYIGKPQFLEDKKTKKVKKNILVVKSWNVHALDNFAPSAYSCANFALNGEQLEEWSKPNKIIREQKEVAQQASGEINMELFKLKRFLNGKTLFTFEDEDKAQKVLDAINYAKEKELPSRRKSFIEEQKRKSEEFEERLAKQREMQK
jgi:hypothetical protein